MAVLTFQSRPVAPSIRDEIAAALDIPAPYVDVYVDRLEVVGMVDESMRSTVEQVLASHDASPPPPPDPNVELRKAIDAATNFEELKAALLGTNRPAMVAARGKAV